MNQSESRQRDKMLLLYYLTFLAWFTNDENLWACSCRVGLLTCLMSVLISNDKNNFKLMKSLMKHLEVFWRLFLAMYGLNAVILCISLTIAILKNELNALNKLKTVN